MKNSFPVTLATPQKILKKVLPRTLPTSLDTTPEASPLRLKKPTTTQTMGTSIFLGRSGQKGVNYNALEEISRGPRLKSLEKKETSGQKFFDIEKNFTRDEVSTPSKLSHSQISFLVKPQPDNSPSKSKQNMNSRDEFSQSQVSFFGKYKLGSPTISSGFIESESKPTSSQNIDITKRMSSSKRLERKLNSFLWSSKPDRSISPNSKEDISVNQTTVKVNTTTQNFLAKVGLSRKKGRVQSYYDFYKQVREGLGHGPLPQQTDKTIETIQIPERLIKLNQQIVESASLKRVSRLKERPSLETSGKDWQMKESMVSGIVSPNHSIVLQQGNKKAKNIRLKLKNGNEQSPIQKEVLRLCYSCKKLRKGISAIDRNLSIDEAKLKKQYTDIDQRLQKVTHMNFLLGEQF